MYSERLTKEDGRRVERPASATMPSFEELKLAGLFGPKSSILDTVGRTPVVRLNNVGPDHVSVFAKLEAFNPLGSVKDRLALSVIEDAERSGRLKPGQTVVEATSGNTGIGLAMVCAQKGYPLVIVMAESFSTERRRLMRFLGAKVVLTPAEAKGTGMVEKARELALTHGWFLADQFANPANATVHARTTAIEILADFETTGLDYWVTGFGTGGTLRGVADILRQHSPQTDVVVAEPDNVPMLASQLDNPDAEGQSHTLFRPHPMQGWSPDFLSQFALEARDQSLIDHFVAVNGNVALQTARELACREGILAGISGGATVAAAFEVAKTAPAGSNILAMVPDTGERYLSTPLFDGIDEDMDADELDISRSTKGFRFDEPTIQPVTETPKVPASVNPEVNEFIDRTINDSEAPVVMFALEWCEFCWSVQRFFDAIGVPCRKLDLDAAAFEGGQEFVGDMRAALNARTGSRSIPQIFVGGRPLGGATETFDAYNAKTLEALLKDLGIEMQGDTMSDAYAFLPKWLQKR